MSPLLFLGVGLMMLANILHIVGLATPHWLDLDDTLKNAISQGNVYARSSLITHTGLFDYCTDDNCASIKSNNISDSLKAVRAFCIIGVLLAFAGVALVVLFILLKKLQNNKLIPIGMLLAGVAACGSILLGVIIFGAEEYNSETHDYGYSFALSIVGALGIGAGGVLSFVGARASAASS